MNCKELFGILKKKFEDKCSSALLLDAENFIHLFSDIQFVDKKGGIIGPWIDSGNFVFIDDCPFYKIPIGSLLLVHSHLGEGTYINPILIINNKLFTAPAIFIESPAICVENFISTLKIPYTKETYQK